MKVLRRFVAFFFLAGCASSWDPHAPGTVTAPEAGGPVQVSHGQRLELRLPAAPQGMEWRLREPAPVVVMAVGAPAPDGLRMTPVRSGKEMLRLVQVPVAGEAEPARSVSYEVTVP